jgi:hypothetical protein
MPGTSVHIVLTSPTDGDDEELSMAAEQLREELLDLDVDDVTLVRRGVSPEGTKAGDVMAWGELVTTLAASGGVVTSLIGVIQAWISRNRTIRTAVIEVDGDRLELSGVSTETQQQLLEAWKNRRLNESAK